MSKVIILSGVSGAGKSSFVPSDVTGEAEVVSADHFFLVKGEYRFDPSKLADAHAECFRRYISALIAGVTLGRNAVIVDNTNTTAVEIAPYVLGAQAYGYSPKIITVNVPESALEACAARNRHGVSLQGIRAQWERLQARQLPPWWEHETVEARF